jgi:hypothetical protein
LPDLDRTNRTDDLERGLLNLNFCCLCHDPSQYKARNDQQRGHRRANTDDQSCFQYEPFFVERNLLRRPHEAERQWHQCL